MPINSHAKMHAKNCLLAPLQPAESQRLAHRDRDRARGLQWTKSKIVGPRLLRRLPPKGNTFRARNSAQLMVSFRISESFQ